MIKYVLILAIILVSCKKQETVKQDLQSYIEANTDLEQVNIIAFARSSHEFLSPSAITVKNRIKIYFEATDQAIDIRYFELDALDHVNDFSTYLQGNNYAIVPDTAFDGAFFHITLTNLPNKKFVVMTYKTAEKLYASALRSKREIAFAIIDIDKFKIINDVYGHDVGDKALQHVTAIIKDSMQRQSDLIGRFGGEEFVILADNIKHSDAYIVFNNLRRDIQKSPCLLENNISLELTVSIGVYTKHEKDVDASLKEADKLLYQAKSAGRNRVVINDE